MLTLICHAESMYANNTFEKNFRHSVGKQISKLMAQWDYLDALWHPYWHTSVILYFLIVSRVHCAEAGKAFGVLTWRHVQYTTIPPCKAITQQALPTQSCENRKLGLKVNKIRQSWTKNCHSLLPLPSSSIFTATMNIGSLHCTNWGITLPKASVTLS